MFTEEELNFFADMFADRFGNINVRILSDMAETLQKTGDMIPSYGKQIQQMYTYGYDMDLITKELARESGKSIGEIERLYKAVAMEGNEYSKPFYEARGIGQIPFKENKTLQNIIRSAAAVTAGTLKNISSTTTVGIMTGKGLVISQQKTGQKHVEQQIWQQIKKRTTNSCHNKHLVSDIPDCHECEHCYTN